MRQLVAFEVKGLLGQFNHKIDLRMDGHVTILYGPNGVGKTKVLEIIQGALSLSLPRLAKVPFDEAVLRFSDGYVLAVANGSHSASSPSDEDDRFDNLLSELSVEFGLSSPTGHTDTWSPRKDLEDVANTQPALINFDRMDVEFQNLPESERRRFRDRELNYLLRGRRGERLRPPTWLREFCEGFPAHMVQTQRLVIGDETSDPAGKIKNKAAVQAFREDLSGRIKAALADNSKTAARLDRTFPRRIMLATATDSRITDAEIRKKFQTQSRKRTALSRVGLADNAEELPLPDKELEPLERKVLWTYLEDMEEKLHTFDPLLARVERFVDIVNSKFLYKSMAIDQEEGFTFRADDGRPIPAAGLSSGEQHELVLTYSLLFNTVPGSLVMIDEPEISLHVVWQQQFISDLEKISEVVKMQFLIATHSPQIINKWWDRAVALEPDPSLFA